MRVLLVDDHALFSQSLAIVLSDFPSVEQFSNVKSIDEIGPIIERDKPDILLMDINLGKLAEEDGLLLAQSLLQNIPIKKLLFCRDMICLFTEKKLKSLEQKVLSTRILNQKNCYTFLKE